MTRSDWAIAILLLLLGLMSLIVILLWPPSAFI